MIEPWKTDPETWEAFCAANNPYDKIKDMKSRYNMLNRYRYDYEHFSQGFSAGRASMSAEVERLRAAHRQQGN
jgi:hypothetical protein